MQTFGQYLAEVDNAYYIKRNEGGRVSAEVQKLERILKILEALKETFQTKQKVDISNIQLDAELIDICEQFALKLPAMRQYTNEQLSEHDNFLTLFSIITKKYDLSQGGVREVKQIASDYVPLTIFSAIKLNDFSFIKEELERDSSILQQYSTASGEQHYRPFSAILHKMRVIADIPGRENDFNQFAEIAKKIASASKYYKHLDHRNGSLLNTVFLSARTVKNTKACDVFINIGKTLLDTINDTTLIQQIMSAEHEFGNNVKNTLKDMIFKVLYKSNDYDDQGVLKPGRVKSIERDLAYFLEQTRKIMTEPWEKFVARPGLLDDQKENKREKESSASTSSLSGSWCSFTSSLSSSASLNSQNTSSGVKNSLEDSSTTPLSNTDAPVTGRF